MIPRIESTLGQTTLEIQPDSDGEERVLQAEAVLELDISLYQEETVSLLQDVYHPHRECIPKVQEETLESLLIRNSSKCRLTDKLQMRVPKNKILQICHSDGKIKIDEERIVGEMATGAFRSGAQIYLTYYAELLARLMDEGRIG